MVLPILKPKQIIRNGLVAHYAPIRQRNLLKWSEDFSNAVWTKYTGVTIAPDSAIAPDGTLTADVITFPPTGGASPYIYQSSNLDIIKEYVVSIWIRRVSGTGTMVLKVFGNSSKNLSITSDWVRYSFTVANGDILRPLLSRNGSNGTDILEIWGAQLELASQVTTYQKTTDMQTLPDYSRPKVNLVPGGKERFEGWTAYEGSAVTVTQNQSVAEWATTKATRVQTIGGTHVLKYYVPLVTSVLNQLYSMRMLIKNIGSNTMQVSMNLGSATQDVLPGEVKMVSIENIVGTGVANVQIQFRSLNAGDSLNFYAYQPMVNVGSISSYVDPPYPGQLGSTAVADTNDPTFDGQGVSFVTDDYIDCGNNLNFGITTGLSVDILFKVKTGLLTTNTLFSKGDNGSNVNYCVDIQPAGGIRFFGYASGISKGLVSGISGNYADDNWYLGQFRFNGVNWYCHINNVLKGSTENSCTLTTNNLKLYIGCRASSLFYNGCIAFMNFYNRSLSEAERSRNYQVLKQECARYGVMIA